MNEWEGVPEEHVTLLLPAWRHRKTGKLHCRRECRAVQFHADKMVPLLVRMDEDYKVIGRAEKEGGLCRYCFAW